ARPGSRPRASPPNRSPPRRRRAARRAPDSARAAHSGPTRTACPRTGAARSRDLRATRAVIVRCARSVVRCQPMRALVLGLLVAGASAPRAPPGPPGPPVQEAILRVKPAVVLVTAEVRADV